MRKRTLRPWVKVVMAVAAGILSGNVLPDAEETVSEAMNLPVTRAEEYVTDAEAEAEPKSLRDWQKINPDVKYVLEFRDDEAVRTIPVVTVKEDASVMKHNLYGEYDTMGSVFTDAMTYEPDNLVIYGHASKTKDWNFTFLKKFADQNYFERHPEFTLTEESGKKNCQVVSFGEYDLDEESVYLGWADAGMPMEEQRREMFLNTVPYLIQKRDGVMDEGLGIVTLVTCNLNGADVRYVLQAAVRD